MRVALEYAVFVVGQVLVNIGFLEIVLDFRAEVSGLERYWWIFIFGEVEKDQNPRTHEMTILFLFFVVKQTPWLVKLLRIPIQIFLIKLMELFQNSCRETPIGQGL